MKKKTRILAIAVFLAITAISCQKEEQLSLQQPKVESNATYYAICYSIDGQLYSQTVVGEQALQALMLRIVDLSSNGHSVLVWDSSCQSNQPSKDTVTYVTNDKNDATSWMIMMTLKGYKVSIEEKNGIFTCTAVS